jgi:hypothetical protein
VLVRLRVGVLLLGCGCERTVASLAVVYAAGEGKYLPEVVHLTGDTRSVGEIARIMEEAGAGD